MSIVKMRRFAIELKIFFEEFAFFASASSRRNKSCKIFDTVCIYYLRFSQLVNYMISMHSMYAKLWVVIPQYSQIIAVLVVMGVESPEV